MASKELENDVKVSEEFSKQLKESVEHTHYVDKDKTLCISLNGRLLKDRRMRVLKFPNVESISSYLHDTNLSGRFIPCIMLDPIFIT